MKQKTNVKWAWRAEPKVVPWKEQYSSQNSDDKRQRYWEWGRHWERSFRDWKVIERPDDNLMIINWKLNRSRQIPRKQLWKLPQGDTETWIFLWTHTKNGSSRSIVLWNIQVTILILHKLFHSFTLTRFRHQLWQAHRKKRDVEVGITHEHTCKTQPSRRKPNVAMYKKMTPPIYSRIIESS